MPGIRLFATLALAAALGAAPAHAQKREREAAAAPGALAPVGQGERTMRKDLAPGAWITPRHRQAVADYLARQGPRARCLPGTVRAGEACRPAAALPPWRIGAPLAPGARTHAPPPGLLAVLPKAPPGNRYVLYGGDILLVAAGSRMVLDAVPLSSP